MLKRGNIMQKEFGQQNAAKERLGALSIN